MLNVEEATQLNMLAVEVFFCLLTLCVVFPLVQVLVQVDVDVLQSEQPAL